MNKKNFNTSLIRGYISDFFDGKFEKKNKENIILYNPKKDQVHYKRIFNQLDEDERRLFEDISTGAGLWSSFGLKRTTTSQEEVDDKDFQLLKGEYLAGNNNPQVITALRRLTVKMINNGRMSRHQGHNLLMELSSV